LKGTLIELQLKLRLGSQDAMKGHRGTYRLHEGFELNGLNG